VTDPPAWWETYNDNIIRARGTGWGGDEPLLSPETCSLLDDVDSAFAITGAHTPGWLNPYQDGSTPDEEAHERSTHPEKFRILVTRAQAWVRVLVNRGWAREASDVEWALRPMESGGADTVLAPLSHNTVPLVLTTHTPANSSYAFTITIAAGSPAVRLASLPDCACDGCDRGSADLLRELDRWVLSVVDGSLEVEVGTDRYWVRTSFGYKIRPTQNLHEATKFVAAPWPADWTPRPLVSLPTATKR